MEITGAFLQTELKDKGIHVRMEGRMVELLVMVDHSLYRPYVIIECDKPVFYNQLWMALYGMPLSAPPASGSRYWMTSRSSGSRSTLMTAAKRIALSAELNKLWDSAFTTCL